MRTVDFVRNRLREPSTWLGLVLALSQGAAAAKTGDWSAIGSAIAGVLGMILPEGKSVR